MKTASYKLQVHALDSQRPMLLHHTNVILLQTLANDGENNKCIPRCNIITLNAKWASKSSEISASFEKGSLKIIKKTQNYASSSRPLVTTPGL